MKALFRANYEGSDPGVKVENRVWRGDDADLSGGDTGQVAQTAGLGTRCGTEPPVSGFTKMPFFSTSQGSEQPLLNCELLGYGRDL